MRGRVSTLTDAFKGLSLMGKGYLRCRHIEVLPLTRRTKNSSRQRRLGAAIFHRYPELLSDVHRKDDERTRC